MHIHIHIRICIYICICTYISIDKYIIHIHKHIIIDSEIVNLKNLINQEYNVTLNDYYNFISDVLNKSLPPVWLVSKMRVNSRWTDMSEWVFDCLKGVSRSFLYELKGYRYDLFWGCHDPSRTPQTLSAGQGWSEQMSEPDIRLTNSRHRTGLLDGRFPGIPRCLNVLETTKTRKPD